MDLETSEELAKADWEGITVKLLAYARKRVLRMSWSSASATLPKIEDAVYEAINRVITGDRKRNREKYPDLLILLYTVVKSIISHEADSSENAKTEVLSDTLERPDWPVEVGQAGQVYMDRLLDGVSGDAELENLVLYIATGYSKASDLAEKMGMPIQKMYRLRERLERRIDQIKAENVKGAGL